MFFVFENFWMSYFSRETTICSEISTANKFSLIEKRIISFKKIYMYVYVNTYTYIHECIIHTSILVCHQKLDRTMHRDWATDILSTKILFASLTSIFIFSFKCPDSWKPVNSFRRQVAGRPYCFWLGEKSEGSQPSVSSRGLLSESRFRVEVWEREPQASPKNVSLLYRILPIKRTCPNERTGSIFHG